MTKANLGLGVLALPSVFSVLGLVPGILIILVVQTLIACKFVVAWRWSGVALEVTACITATRPRSSSGPIAPLSTHPGSHSNTVRNTRSHVQTAAW